MAQSVFPAPAAAPSSIGKTVVSATASQIAYQSNVSLIVGTYTITCVSSTIAYVTFFASNGSVIGSTNTTSGTVTYNLATEATKIHYYTNTGSDVVVSIQLTGIGLVTSAVSGTLDTITTTGSYATTGNLYVVAWGGGGAGSQSSSGANGAGGSTGNIAEGLIVTTSATTVTLGAGGVGTNASGGSTTFGGFLTATGGASTGASSSYPLRRFVKNGFPGTGGTGCRDLGGGGTAGRSDGTAGVGSIGVGGNGGSQASRNGTNATGYASGGGAGGFLDGTAAGTGGNGTQGIVYVLRGF